MTDAEDTRESLVADARKSFGTEFTEAVKDARTGPGRYEGAEDAELTVAAEMFWLNGDVGDETYGDGEVSPVTVRFGRVLLVTESTGFVSATEHESPEVADKIARVIEGETPA